MDEADDDAGPEHRLTKRLYRPRISSIRIDEKRGIVCVNSTDCVSLCFPEESRVGSADGEECSNCLGGGTF